MVVKLVSWAIVIVWIPEYGGRASFIGYSDCMDSLIWWSS